MYYFREVNENEKTPDQSKLIKRKKTTSKVGSKDKSSSATVTAEDLTSGTLPFFFETLILRLIHRCI